MREWCNSHYVITVLKLSQVWPFPRPNPISGFFFFFFLLGGGGGEESWLVWQKHSTCHNMSAFIQIQIIQ